MANTALPARTITPAARLPRSPRLRRAGSGIEIAFRTDPTVHDGRFNNNGWLQELPKPLTHLTWDNAVLVSPATHGAARRHARRRTLPAASAGRFTGRSSRFAIAGDTVRGAMFAGRRPSG